jgi:hypothetical protein
LIVFRVSVVCGTGSIYLLVSCALNPEFVAKGTSMISVCHCVFKLHFMVRVVWLLFSVIVR